MTSIYDDKPDGVVPSRSGIPHYYGDTVRTLLLVIGILMLISVPFDTEFLNFFLTVGIFAVLIITFLAGFTSPREKTVIVANAVITALLFVLFEYAAINILIEQNFDVVNIVFALRQLIALAALVALYFSAKTIRGYILHR